MTDTPLGQRTCKICRYQGGVITCFRVVANIVDDPNKEPPRMFRPYTIYAHEKCFRQWLKGKR